MIIPPFKKAWFSPAKQKRLDELLAVAEKQGWRRWVRTRSESGGHVVPVEAAVAVAKLPIPAMPKFGLGAKPNHGPNPT